MEKKIAPLLNYLTTLGFEVKIVEVREREVLLEVQGDTSKLNELSLNMQLPPTLSAEIIDIQGNKAVVRIVDLEELIILDVQRYVNTYVRSGWLR